MNIYLYKCFFAKKYEVPVKTTVFFSKIKRDDYIIVKLAMMNKNTIFYFLNKMIFLTF